LYNKKTQISLTAVSEEDVHHYFLAEKVAEGVIAFQISR